jgi:signal transduction histidine kinase/integral membrane sensor domain MASE1
MLATLRDRFSRVRPARRVAATALLVAAGYYVGANIGFILRLPPATPSVVWPPNSVLTATLLLAPRRRWWIYLLAALPAHLAAALPALQPVSLAVVLFATNCSEALIAALCVRAFSDAAGRLDTLRRVVVFIAGAALLAPFLSSFADAAAVTLLRGEPYWTVWTTRFFSNVLTELTVASTIVTVACAIKDMAAAPSLRRRAEAALLAVLLVVVAILVFTVRGSDPASAEGSSRPLFAWLLPLLLWAAVRFAPVGVSLSLLTTTLVAIWAASRSQGPFTDEPAENVLSLQLSLSVLAIPLMCLAALTEERRKVQSALAERLRFEEFLARLSAAFVHLPSQEVDRVMAASLEKLGEFLHLDRVALLRFPAEEDGLAVSQAWAAPGFQAHPAAVVSRDHPAAAERLRQEAPFLFSRSLERDLSSVPDTDVRTSVTLPLVATHHVIGGLALESIAADRIWPEKLVPRLQLVAEVFAHAMARKEAEDALRASELMKSAILASLSSGVAVLDRDGRVIAVNQTWTASGDDPLTTPYAGAAVGADYVEICRAAMRQGKAYAMDMVAGTEEVLCGARRAFSLEYVSLAPKAERWFSVSVVPLHRPEGGAVVSHTEVTERKRAEVQAQRSREELAHFARVSMMGELTASLAHELSQPLTGIMTNAQAARRFLEATPPRLEELRAAVQDIIADDRRAANVIHRLRDLLRKGELRQARLDLNDLVGDVTRLVGSDAIIRSTTMVLELDPSPVVVSGDRVQLEQVMLNLLLNAMDAMSEVAEAERTIVIRTENAPLQKAQVAVQDAGTGLSDVAEARIFEPFYTTKATGMGMGLSIARSIIEAHGGSIWATNNQSRGATFHFALPRTEASP